MSNEHLLLMQLRHNVHVTAAFKVHQNIFEMSNALFDDQGNVVSKAAFLKKAEGISDKFNKNWSKTEYNHAVRASKSANQWLTFESRKKYLKNITWHAIKDENTRATHALLDGITLPVDHPFWDTHPVPYDWECRCYKTQNNDPIVEPPTDLPEPKAMFKNNPGKTGKAFLESHPYYSVDQNYANLAKRVFDVSLPISPSRLKENTQLYFKFMENKNYSLEYTDNLTGGFVTKHVDADAKDLRDNLRAAKILARENGDAIEIRQHIHKDGIKNPEFSINGVASDLKTPDRRKFKEVSTAIKNQFSRARKQDLNNLVIKVDGQYGLELIEEGVIEGFNRNEVIERVRIIYGGKAVEITRVEMEKGKVFDKLKDRL